MNSIKELIDERREILKLVSYVNINALEYSKNLERLRVINHTLKELSRMIEEARNEDISES